MASFKEDLISLRRGFTERGHRDIRYFLNQINSYISSLSIFQQRNYKRELELAERAGVLKITYFDTKTGNIKYKMKGIPQKNL